jgi:hypothetical protein
MILKPDDILQKGDIIHFSDGGIDVMRGDSMGLNMKVGRLASCIAYVERPDPVEPLGYEELMERIKLLRDALKKCQVVINRTNDWDSAVADAYNTAHEVLEATR